MNDLKEPTNKAKDDAQEDDETNIPEDLTQKEIEILDDHLGGLEPEKRERVLSMMMEYSGPLPPAEQLKGYVEVYPEAAQKMFQWIEEEQNHRFGMEREHMTKSYNYSRLGLIGGFVLSFTFVILSFVLIFTDKEALGLTLIGGFIVSLTAIIVNQKKTKEKKESTDDEKND